MLPVRSNGNGYMRVSVRRDGVSFHPYVHQMVCEAFCGPCPDGMQTRHLDGVRANNSAANLQWSTKVVNEADKIKHGTLAFGERGGMAVLTEAVVIAARRRASEGTPINELATEYGVHTHTLADAIRGRKWRHLDSPVKSTRRFLTNEDVRDIKDAVRRGVRKVDLARKHNVHWGTIQRIILGTRRADVP